MMPEWLNPALNGGGLILMALLLYRVDQIEHKLGNGKPGVFVRREEHDALHERVERVEEML